MYTGKFSIASLILYVFIGIIGMLCMRKYIRRRKESINCCILFVILYTGFAAFRKVDYRLGGTDAHNYLYMFKNALTMTPADYSRSGYIEYIFYGFNRLLRFITSNETVYFAICYGIIAISYVVFIRKFADRNISSIPFVLLVFLYLRSFCTMRSSLAIAVFLIGLTLIEEKKILSLAMIVSACFIHRMSIIFVLIFPFYYIYKYKLAYMKKGRLLAFSSIYICLSVVLATSLRATIRTYGLLSSTDLWYATSGQGESLLNRWPMFIVQLILLIMMIIMRNKIQDTDNVRMIQTFCIFDFIMLPASIILGVWRENEFLYIARLIMWGNVINAGESLFRKNSRFLYKILVFGVFCAWLIFRIYSEWDDLKIMPYVFKFFGE